MRIDCQYCNQFFKEKRFESYFSTIHDNCMAHADLQQNELTERIRHPWVAL